MSAPPSRVVMVGATIAGPGFVEITCVPSLADADEHVGNPGVVLALADSAPTGGPFEHLDVARRHDAAGGRVVILRETHVAEALTWDVPGAEELVLPASYNQFAAMAGLDPRRVDAPIVAAVPASARLTEADAVRGWKRGLLWLDAAGTEVLVSGPHARMPVSVDATSFCDEHTEHPNGSPDPDVACYSGFSAFLERHLTADCWPTALVMEVALHGTLLLAGTPRASNLHWFAGHQRVVAVELTGVCRECGAPADQLSGKNRDDQPTVLVERCAEHAAARTLTVGELAALLPEVELRRPL